ncbi:MAG: DUF1549 domain-containing protein, partial [Gemmata sp.]
MRTSITLAVLLALGAARGRGADADAAAVAFFEKQVRPVLAEHCHGCHSAKANKTRGGLALDSREAMLKGGESGPAVVPGKPDSSLLVKAVRAPKGELQMPPNGKLRPAQIAALEAWVRDGAVYPAGAKGTVALDPTSAEARQFWSFRPLRDQALPAVKDNKWPERRIDSFLLAEMERRKLAPSQPADRRTLIRRASFDLTGLPPTSDEVDAFVNDKGPDAYARVIGRLLASPHYGE